MLRERGKACPQDLSERAFAATEAGFKSGRDRGRSATPTFLNSKAIWAPCRIRWALSGIGAGKREIYAHLHHLVGVAGSCPADRGCGRGGGEEFAGVTTCDHCESPMVF